MTMTIGRCLGLTAAAAVIAVFALGAQAQEKKTETPKAAKTEKKPAACKTLKTQAPCEERVDCNWVSATKNGEGKITKRAYCRGNVKKAEAKDVKKADPKKADPKKN